MKQYLDRQELMEERNDAIYHSYKKVKLTKTLMRQSQDCQQLLEDNKVRDWSILQNDKTRQEHL